ncbi:MAG: hypothetical protein VKJ24_08895 [Synechococcales bacterium]|nr:hypothetical protein [Synechococcales bacterium]
MQAPLWAMSATLLLQLPAQAAPRYGSINLGGSAYFSWMQMSQPTTKPDADGNLISGYACTVKDTLKGMAKTATVERYAIIGTEKAGDLKLKPIGGAIIRPEGKGYKVQDYPPTPETLPNLMEALSSKKQGKWYKSDFAPGKLDRACVEGGIVGALKQLEKDHKIKLTR